MESKIISKNKTKKEIKYPCLMVLHIGDEKIVVLAHKDVGDDCFAGTLLLNNTKEPYEIGAYEEDWIFEDFYLLEESLVLNN